MTRTIAKALNPRAAIISNRSLSPLALTFVQVARTVAFVRSSSLLLSIRAGGPSTSGPARELNSPFNRPSQPLISTPQAVFILHLSPRSCPRCSSLPPATGIRPPTGAPDCPARSGSSSKNRSPSLAPVSSSPCSFFSPRPGWCQSILTSAHPEAPAWDSACP